MKMLSTEVRTLLDKLYNLRGEDSVILTKMTKEREDAIETQERTKNEKEVLIKEIENLTAEEKTLAEEGEKLTSVLSSINKNDFATVLDRLKIDFDPDVINEKVNKMLPDTIAKVVAENKKASEKLESVEAEMNNAITKVEELGIRKDEALSNQAKLNEYFDLALAGNINITRDEITSLLEKFDFTENEQREAAKILMFPEDALYEYDASYKSGDKASGKTITEVLVEAKKESTAVQPEAKVEESESISDLEPIKASADSEPILEDIFNKVIEENIPVEPTPQVENSSAPIFADPTPIVEDKQSEKEKLYEVMRESGLDPEDYNAKSIEKLLTNYNADTLKNNVAELKNKNIDLKILRENIEILYDLELAQKIDKLLALGKEARDISLMPNVLVKYDLKGLNNTINVLQISGLDPKKVPLMAY
ncbi:MAG TPA: hypothetical protein IAB40_02555 [Candidatus Onthocola stercoravium]|nr:hypothetical protein [Candidatus Onthocola stercoravium]